MLTINLDIHGKEKDSLLEEEKRIKFSDRMNSIGLRSYAHHAFDYDASTEYINIFGVSGAVSISATIRVEKRKLTKQTISIIEKDFILRVVDRYEDTLDNIRICVKVDDDAGRTFEKEYEF